MHTGPLAQRPLPRVEARRIKAWTRGTLTASALLAAFLFMALTTTSATIAHDGHWTRVLCDRALFRPPLAPPHTRSANVFLSACFTGGMFYAVRRFLPSHEDSLAKGKEEVEPREDL